ncbi:unnamed protein product [Caenorhabditis sp. 36 PRJEB53466]|nr:unnamed protein product [Caenorhabditis sp. 36 PRJEB53466]
MLTKLFMSEQIMSLLLKSLFSNDFSIGHLRCTFDSLRVECLHTFVYYAPIYAVLTLGIYAVFNVVSGVATFNDCSAAKEELLREIKEAREELKQKKIIE